MLRRFRLFGFSGNLSLSDNRKGYASVLVNLVRSADKLSFGIQIEFKPSFENQKSSFSAYLRFENSETGYINVFRVFACGEENRFFSVQSESNRRGFEGSAGIFPFKRRFARKFEDFSLSREGVALGDYALSVALVKLIARIRENERKDFRSRALFEAVENEGFPFDRVGKNLRLPFLRRVAAAAENRRKQNERK